MRFDAQNFYFAVYGRKTERFLTSKYLGKSKLKNTLVGLSRSRRRSLEIRFSERNRLQKAFLSGKSTNVIFKF